MFDVGLGCSLAGLIEFSQTTEVKKDPILTFMTTSLLGFVRRLLDFRTLCVVALVVSLTLGMKTEKVAVK